MRIKEKKVISRIYILDFPIFSRFLYFTFSSIHTYASRSDSVNVVVVFSLCRSARVVILFVEEEKLISMKITSGKEGKLVCPSTRDLIFSHSSMFPYSPSLSPIACILFESLFKCLPSSTSDDASPADSHTEVCGTMMKKRSWIIYFADTILQRIEEDDAEVN